MLILYAPEQRLSLRRKPEPSLSVSEVSHRTAHRIKPTLTRLLIKIFSFAVELSRIWEQLDQITHFLDTKASERPCLAKEPLPCDLVGDQDPLNGFPIMTIRNQSFLALLELDQSLGVQIEQMERGRPLFCSRPSSVPIVVVDYAQALE